MRRLRAPGLIGLTQIWCRCRRISPSPSALSVFSLGSSDSRAYHAREACERTWRPTQSAASTASRRARTVPTSHRRRCQGRQDSSNSWTRAVTKAPVQGLLLTPIGEVPPSAE
ncbi:hypothetical protein ACQPZZ_32560 [Microbispora sp. CA-135349]|uniref:hypothetical protein n=1 Tax=Microbispora sp. CA-135349 TaxID=3239953 RepID=UPI003D91FD82